LFSTDSKIYTKAKNFGKIGEVGCKLYNVLWLLTTNASTLGLVLWIDHL